MDSSTRSNQTPSAGYLRREELIELPDRHCQSDSVLMDNTNNRRLHSPANVQMRMESGQSGPSTGSRTPSGLTADQASSVYDPTPEPSRRSVSQAGNQIDSNAIDNINNNDNIDDDNVIRYNDINTDDGPMDVATSTRNRDHSNSFDTATAEDPFNNRTNDTEDEDNDAAIRQELARRRRNEPHGITRQVTFGNIGAGGMVHTSAQTDVSNTDLNQSGHPQNWSDQLGSTAPNSTLCGGSCCGRTLPVWLDLATFLYSLLALVMLVFGIVIAVSLASSGVGVVHDDDDHPPHSPSYGNMTLAEWSAKQLLNNASHDVKKKSRNTVPLSESSRSRAQYWRARYQRIVDPTFLCYVLCGGALTIVGFCLTWLVNEERRKRLETTDALQQRRYDQSTAQLWIVGPIFICSGILVGIKAVTHVYKRLHPLPNNQFPGSTSSAGLNRVPTMPPSYSTALQSPVPSGVYEIEDKISTAPGAGQEDEASLARITINFEPEPPSYTEAIDLIEQRRHREEEHEADHDTHTVESTVALHSPGTARGDTTVPTNNGHHDEDQGQAHHHGMLHHVPHTRHSPRS